MSFMDLFPVKRKDKKSQWSFLLHEPIFDLIDPTDIYLDRLWLIRTPFASIALHKINRPDADRAMHNHPWAFASIILLGGYREDVFDDRRIPTVPRRPIGGRTRFHRTGDLNVMGLHNFHVIRTLARVPTWTLVFMGPKVRSWGYLVGDGTGGQWVFMDHDLYHHERNPEYTDEGLLRKERV